MRSCLASTAFGSVLFALAFTASAATLPRHVVVDVRLEVGSARLHVQGKTTAMNTKFVIKAEDFEMPTSGEYRLVLHGASEDREIGRFTVSDEGSIGQEFRIDADWRSFLIGVQSLRLLDGETVEAEEAAFGAASLQVRAKAGLAEGAARRSYRLEGRVERRRDGRSRYKFEAKTERGEPGALTYRLYGPEGFFDISVEVMENGNGRGRAEGNEDLLPASIQWTELIVLDGDVEIARTPLTCR